MIKRAKKVACAVAFLGICAPAADAYACSASETEVYRSQKTVWCVEQSVIAKYGAFPTAFFPYSDSVVDQLVAVFDVPAEGVYTFEASVPSGGAHTGSECCNLGVTVTGDAFYNDGYGATGCWGYLLSLHEMINDFTGQVSGGWPTDFWADHVSAFPNSMDWHIMALLGTKNNDPNLTKASAAQKARFYPGGDSVDARVGMFDQIFDLPNYGFGGLSRVFAWVGKDKLSWDGLGVANPDKKRTEYVMAYLSLGAGKQVTSIMQAANVGNGKDDGAGDPGYNVVAADIDAIASDHCALVSAEAQGVNVTNDWKAFRSGNFAGVTKGGTCGNGCPAAECGCKSSTNKCVPLWLSDNPTAPPDSGVGGGNDDSGIGGGNGDDDGGSGGGAPDATTGSHTDAGKTGGGGGNGDTGGNGSGNGDTGSSGGCGAAPLSTPLAPVGTAIFALGVVTLLARRRRH